MFGRATFRLGIGPHSSWLCFPGMTASPAKNKQVIGAPFQMFFSTIFLFFDVPQY